MSKSDSDDPQSLDYANPRNRLAKRFNWMLWLVLLPAVLVLLTWLIWPRFNSGRTVPQLIKSASNLRQIGLAILLYTNDHQGEFPDSFATLLQNEDVISSYEFVSPARSETPANGPTTRAIAGQLTAGNHLSYVYLGRGLSEKTLTPDTVLAYELIGPNGTNVLFGDGHVEWVDAALAAEIVAKASNGPFPVTMPAQ
jgi:prepilin-type processing-associated H-X9-DG protein